MPDKKQTTIRIGEDGTVQPNNDDFVRWLGNVLDLFSDGRAVVTIERPKRTLGQNRMYWGYCIRPIRHALLEAGYTISEKALHNHFKELYLGIEKSFEYTDRETGEVREVTEVRSTTKLDQTEFDRYVERIRESELVRQLGVYLPRPGDPDEAFIEAKSR